jgi:photosystem II stability/assembly factor-like uncharacterized protein
MKYFLSALALSSLLFSCKKQTDEPTGEPPYDSRDTLDLITQNFPVNNSTIRSIKVLNDSTMWYAGSGGKCGYTDDNGANWNRFTLEHEGKKAELRSIDVINGEVFAVGVADPAVVFHSADNGGSWSVIFEDTRQDAFLNGIRFFDENDGIIIGDPIDGCWLIALTSDGGLSWDTLPCSSVPQADDGEFPYAASNSNFDIVGDDIWIGSGGTKARVYHSGDRGLSWEVFDTPIKTGTMHGIFTLDFYDEEYGIIAGGNWSNAVQNDMNMAVTTNGGKTWTLVADGVDPNYTSCVHYIPGTQHQEIISLNDRVAAPGGKMMYSSDGGDSWMELNSKSFLTVQMSSLHRGWMAGENKIARIDINN